MTSPAPRVDDLTQGTAVLLIGGGTGLAAGLFGAGGSAVGTPLPHLAGVPPFVALASPLPTALPVALVSSGAYRRRRHLARRVLTWSVAVELPATVAGALLTPLYLTVLGLPINRALATSLAVSAALALPGSVTHWTLGHVDRRVTLAHTAPAVPAAYLGARVAVRAHPGRLTRLYGVALVPLASALLLR
ncbi:sulfite exporter TauE/SafE family protein [Micromonospora siamensis]|uniref:Probable membrane transporter protein n=1 Tax=Micromonospora siamensis TaxID=299152 RepID=A0A1C5J4P7_9ACTN|nr:sulfite exporter TauE/SafE family protein [Micromonospora siamensis]SCG65527.1 Sulfite exporter TauE/SafE [Micromonospora siamensis]